jgi:fatty aldehyde-generating acyl-ACP reductase
MEAQQLERKADWNLAAFQHLIKTTERLVDHLEGAQFHSLYTVLPLMTQFLGLENPLFGSGKSPFSVISILPRITDPSIVKWGLALSLEQRRELLDEVYDMIAPILLGEEEAYLALLANTIRHEEFGASPSRREAFLAAQREKVNALSPLVRRLRLVEPGNFAHIAHYDFTSDLLREHAFLKNLPEDLFEEWCLRSFPTVVELNFRGFNGDSSAIRGWVLLINNSTEQLLNSNKLRRGKILQCAKLAEKLGAQIVGMAGLIAFFGKGGHFLSETFPGIGFTTGHAYTIGNILEIAKAAADRVSLPLSDAVIAIVGAAGSIGSGCAKLFAELGPRRLILIDILGGNALDAAARAVKRINPDIEVTCSTRLDEMRAADLSVVATNSPRTIIRPDHLKPGAIVIDDSFPKNVPETITTVRDDLIVLEGGAVRIPARVEIDRARNLPNILDVPFTRMVSCQEVYGCFAETLTLATSGHRGNYGLGPSDPELAKDILAKARNLGISLAPLQFFGQGVSEKRFRQAMLVRSQSEGGTNMGNN